MSKRRGSEGGTTANKKRRVVLTPEEEEARRLKEEIELLESQLKSLDEVAERQTKKKRTEPRTAPPPPPTDVDFWDEEDYDDEVDVGGYAPGSRVASSRARRTPRPSNKYDTQFDTKLAADADVPEAPVFPKRRTTKATKKPVLPAPEWQRILPPTKIPISQRLVNKKQDPMTYCANIVRDIWKHKMAWVFHSPVDPVALNIPEYPNIIKHPMDLSTVQKKLRNKSYATIQDFDEDMRLIWSNAMLFNGVGSDVYVMAKELSRVYDEKFKVAQELDKGGVELKKQQLLKSQKNLLTEKERLEKQVAQLRAQKQVQEKILPPSDTPDMSPPLRSRSEISTEVVSYTDKCQLCNAVNGLQDKYMPGVIKIFREETPQLLRSSNPTVEINTDELNTMTLRRLEAYLNDCKTKDQIMVDRAAGKIVEDPLEVMAAGKKESSSSSSSSGSSSSSDSSDSSSDSEDGGVKPVLIMPSILPQPTTQLTPQTQPRSPPPQPSQVPQPQQGVNVQNIDAWSMLNVNGGVKPEKSPLSPGLPGLGAVKEEEVKSQVDTKVWNDFKNIQAAQQQRERELKQIEEEKQQQLKQKQEEDIRLAQQAAVERQWEEEERVKREKLEREQELEREREAARQRLQQTSQEGLGFDLMGQNSMMTDFENTLRGF